MITMSETFAIGNDLEVNRLGFGAMRLTGREFGAKQQGKIRHIGLSGVKSNDIDRARKVVEIGQNLYNVGDEDVLE
jgi:aryl-alcohol dehydrogenase-like predicted oxidoreductase